jgi:regulator of sigma E protease
MGSFISTIFFFIVALGVLITVHEFGHFWVARSLGVKVLRFSIGFGKPLWGRVGRVDETEYVIAAIPLGGYVKMLDEREGEVKEEEQHRAFNRQSLPVRTAIVAAGPLFNFLFAILAYWLVFVSGDVGIRPVVGEVKQASVAQVAGFQIDDEILAVGGRKTPTWESTIYTLLADVSKGEDVSVLVTDTTGKEQMRILPVGRLGGVADDGDVLGGLGITPSRPVVPAVIKQVLPEEPAAIAGMLPGDRILSVDGGKVNDWDKFVGYIRKHPNETVQLEVSRGVEQLSLVMLVGSQIGDGDVPFGRIGAEVKIPEGLYDEYRVEIRLGPVDAVGAALDKSWAMSRFMLRMLGRMITGQASVKNLGGPISIAQSAGKSASYGALYFLKFLAVVSISLAILNLLPVPVLDGGHLLFFLIEWVKGSPPSEEMQMQGQRIGLALLLALMCVAFYVDISRLLG